MRLELFPNRRPCQRSMRQWAYAASAITLVAVTACGSSPGSSNSSGAGDPIKIGLVAPLSGPNESVGQELETGAQLAVDDVNKSGGIKALGGRKLELDVQDMGATVSGAVTATQTLISDGVISVIGPGISQQSLAIEKTTGAAHIINMELSFLPDFTDGSDPYSFDVSLDQSALSEQQYAAVNQVAEAAGVHLQKIGIITGSLVALASAANILKTSLAPKYGWQVAFDDTVTQGSVTPSSAGTIVSELRQRGVQGLFIGPGDDPDLIDINRAELAAGGKPLPWIISGLPNFSTGFVQALGTAGSNGVVGSGGVGVYPSDASIAKEIAAKGVIPQQYSLDPYAEVYILAAALDKAKSTNSAQLRSALLSLDLKTGPAADIFPEHQIAFAANGRAKYDEAVLVQWQNGNPVTIYPLNLAGAKAIWPNS